jgi:hypothetical protein
MCLKENNLDKMMLSESKFHFMRLKENNLDIMMLSESKFHFIATQVLIATNLLLSLNCCNSQY